VQAVPEEIKSEPVAEAAAAEQLPVTRLTPELQMLRLPKQAGAGTHVRMMAIAATLLVGTFISVGFLLGRNVLDANAQERAPDGVAHRQAAQTVLHKTMALADAGDPRAQARLALAYLRGQGSAADANAALLWCVSAARSGNPVAEYLLGVLYQQGDHVAADPAQAAAWFSRAAEKGNLKAMHNLAIAYAQGLGAPKDETKAAEWFNRAAERGYVDSAFDLAVLYERGEGVPQDLKQALKWYGIAAFAGDQPSKERVEFLRSQMKAADIKLATNAAMAFAPLPAVQEANSL
jgi:localization factor PodJL